MCSRFWGAPEGVRVLTAAEIGGGKAIIDALKEAIERNARDESPNVAPTDGQGVIHITHGKRIISRMEWGFTVTDRPMVINARCETILEKPLFSRQARDRRCLIPVQGYYEWDQGASPKQPYCMRMHDLSIFCLGGVWREYVGHKQFVVITTAVNDLLSRLNDRMPLIISPEDYDLWLEGNVDDALAKCCHPFPSERMTMYPVTKAMSNPKYKVEDAHEHVRTLFDLD